MQAAREIRPGECILAEGPLVCFTPIPSDVIYDNEWLIPGRRANGEPFANGRDTVATHIEQLSAKAKKQFRELHGTSPQSPQNEDIRDRDLRRVQLNAFSDLQQKGGFTYSVERVFYHISRINHSCKPNALMSWNETLKQGTVHALRPIANAEEITIHYCARSKLQFCSIRERCTYLHDTYGFICTCPACGTQSRLERKPLAVPQRRGARTRVNGTSPETDVERDMRLRLELRELHTRIDFDPVVIRIDESSDSAQIEAGRHEQLELLEQYLTALNELAIRDNMLAEAHAAKAKYLEMGMHTASLRRSLGERAPAHLPNDTPLSFMKAAREQWDACYTAYLRMFGSQHPDTESAAEEVRRAMSQVLRLEE